MHGFKSAILEKFKNGNFEPVHEIWRKILPKLFFWCIVTMAIRKNMFQVLPNQGFMQEKVQKGDFLKSPCENWKIIFVIGSYVSLKCLEA